MILGSQKLLTDRELKVYMFGHIWEFPRRWNINDRYQTAANARGVRLRRRRHDARLRYAGQLDPGDSPLNYIPFLPSNVRNPRKRVREDTELPAAKRQSVLDLSWL